MSEALQQTSKKSWLAIQFKYGDPASPSYQRYTDYTSSFVGPGGNNFVSLPTLSVDPISIAGGMDSKDVQIKMSLGAVDSFSDQISSGEPHSPIDVDIWEVIDPAPGAIARTVLHLFKGSVQIVRRNAGGNTEVIEIECNDYKSQLDIPLGLPMMPHCVWVFTGRGCQLDPTGLEETGTLASKDASDGMIVTITGLSSHIGEHDGRYWFRGYVELDGLRIQIRDWTDGDPTTFCLAQEPPARWVGQTVKVFPGCERSITRCRFWSNEEHFGGFGFSVPAYHPVAEDGQ